MEKGTKETKKGEITMSNYYRAMNEDFGKDTEKIMSKFEIIARWIHSDSDEPISEIAWLLREKYKTEKNLLKDYDDIIKEVE